MKTLNKARFEKLENKILNNKKSIRNLVQLNRLLKIRNSCELV